MENVFGTESRRVEEREYLGKPALLGVAICIARAPAERTIAFYTGT